MMLNSVDLPHPEGPMIETNSPEATANDTSSTAVIVPSLVTKLLVIRSTWSRNGSCGGTVAAEAPDSVDARVIGSTSIAASARQRRAHRRVVARLHVHVDDGHAAPGHRLDRCIQRRPEIIEPLDRPPSGRTLRAADRREIDVRIRDALADPFVLAGPVAHACDAF